MSVCLSHSAVVVSWPLWKARGRDKVSLLTGWEVPEDRLIVKSGRGQEGPLESLSASCWHNCDEDVSEEGCVRGHVCTGSSSTTCCVLAFLLALFENNNRSKDTTDFWMPMLGRWETSLY